MPTLPIVQLINICACETTVRELVRVSRLVARWNGNDPVHRRAINLITDDFSLAQAALTDVDFPYTQRKARVLASANSGLFWPHSGVMWIRPGEIRQGQNVLSLAHEMAHAIVPGVHNRTWRRMYAMLLPLWWHALREWDPHGLNLRFEIAHVVRHYAGKRLTADRQREEVDGHVIAADRAYHRWAHLIS